MTAPRPTVPGLPSEAAEYVAAEYVAARRVALQDYVHANEGRFTREALTKAALDAGYEPAEIEAAFERPTRRSRANAQVWLVAIAYVVCLYLAIAVIDSYVPARGLLLPLVLAALGGGLAAAFLLRNTHPNVGYGLGCGVLAAIVLPIVVYTAIIGICIVTGGPIVG